MHTIHTLLANLTTLTDPDVRDDPDAILTILLTILVTILLTIPLTILLTIPLTTL